MSCYYHVFNRHKYRSLDNGNIREKEQKRRLAEFRYINRREVGCTLHILTMQAPSEASHQSQYDAVYVHRRMDSWTIFGAKHTQSYVDSAYIALRLL